MLKPNSSRIEVVKVKIKEILKLIMRIIEVINQKELKAEQRTHVTQLPIEVLRPAHQ